MAKANSSIIANPASNFEVVVLEDGRVALAFDPKKKLGPSKSGKTTLISTTNGAVSVQDFTLSFNAYRKV